MQNSSFHKSIQTMNRIDQLQNFEAQTACLKKSMFCKLNQSMKWIENTKKLSRADSVYKTIWFFSVFWSLSSLHEKIGNQFSLWSNLEKMKIVTTEVACSKNIIFLQTDLVYEMNWLTSNLQRKLLGNFKIFANWSCLWNKLKYFKAS